MNDRRMRTEQCDVLGVVQRVGGAVDGHEVAVFRAQVRPRQLERYRGRGNADNDVSRGVAEGKLLDGLGV